jgi:exodeoxyribonuclease VIII
VDQSFLKSVAHNPAYAKHRRDNPDEDKKCYRKGRLFHTLTLEPDKVGNEYAVKPATYIHHETGEEKPWHGGATVCKQWEKNHSHQTIIDQATIDEATGMALAVRSLPPLQKFLSGAEVEYSVVWIDPATGLLCKARYDAFRDGVVLDLKSTSGNAGVERFKYEAHDHKYWLQSAHYIESVNVLGLRKPKMPAWFRFVAVEGYPPYGCACYDIQDDPSALSYPFLCYGRMKRTVLMFTVKQCMETGVWPGHNPGPWDMELTIPAQNELEKNEL